MTKVEKKNKNDYKVIISELGFSPYHIINLVFALMCVIPLLAACYVIVGKNFLYDLFLNEDGLGMAISIFIAFAGLLYAYKLVKTLVGKLLRYTEEGRIANEAKMDILLAVGSDLKAPLTTMKDGISRLMDSADDAVKGACAGIAQSCYNAVDTMDKFIEEIRSLPESGLIRAGMRRELIDMQDVIKIASNYAAQLAEKKNLNLHIAPVKGNVKLWGDGRKLSRMAMNLIYGAIKYTPEGGAVDIAVLSDENTVQISVRSIGLGLLPADMDEIFEQVEFSIVKDIVDMHNGHITVSGRSDKEVEFKIVLPRDLRMERGFQELRRRKDEGTALFSSENATHVAELMNQRLKNIISYYKADAGKAELKREYIDITPFMEDVISGHETKILKKHVTLKKYIPQDIGSIWADRHKLREVIAGLLDNAIRYTPQSGSIVIKFTGSENEIRLEVCDSGPGIPREKMARLFEKPEGEPAKSLKGSVFNLPVIKNIIEMHRGEIWAESEPGKGARFILTLPKNLRNGGISPAS